jgi:hypothetical protein
VRALTIYFIACGVLNTVLTNPALFSPSMLEFRPIQLSLTYNLRFRRFCLLLLRLEVIPTNWSLAQHIFLWARSARHGWVLEAFENLNTFGKLLVLNPDFCKELLISQNRDR